MKKIMLNEDWIHYISTRYEDNVEVDEQVLKDFIYQYRGTQVTDIALNVNGTVSTYPSKSRQSYPDKYLTKEENGIPVDYSDTYAKKAYEIFIEKGLDMYKIWIDAAREVGIKPWISVRMNDCHGNGKDPELRQSEHVIAHPEQWRVRHREACMYFDRCLDFELEAVRENLLAYIEETLERYRPDGLELDFSRETHMFVPGREQLGRKCLDELMRKIKALAKKYSTGEKPMDINVLINGCAQANLELGLDPALWASEGLIDSFVTISRWATTNTDPEIELWKRLLGDRVELGCGHQLLFNLSPSYEFATISNEDMAYGQACANFYNGSDFVYLYNYMDTLESGLAHMAHPTSVREVKNLRRILENVGEYETASKMRRAHVITYDDFLPGWKVVASRLPIHFSDGDLRYMKFAAGGVRKGERAQVILGFDRELRGEDMKVYVNAYSAKFAGYGGLDENLTDAKGMIFDIQNPETVGGSTIVEVKLHAEAVMEFAEILISE